MLLVTDGFLFMELLGDIWELILMLFDGDNPILFCFKAAAAPEDAILELSGDAPGDCVLVLLLIEEFGRNEEPLSRSLANDSGDKGCELDLPLVVTDEGCGFERLELLPLLFKNIIELGRCWRPFTDLVVVLALAVELFTELIEDFLFNVIDGMELLDDTDEDLDGLLNIDFSLEVAED